MPVVHVLVSGCYPAEQVPRFVDECREAGWDVGVVLTPMAQRFVDVAELSTHVAHPVRLDFKQPGAPDVLPAADAVAVAPATFNTVGKLAAGISDNVVLALANEALGAHVPLVVAPWVNRALQQHPAYASNLSLLESAGAVVVRPPGEGEAMRVGRDNVATFPWAAVHDALRAVREGL